MPPAKTPASQFLGKPTESAMLSLLISTLKLCSQPSCTTHLPLCASALDVALVMIIGDGHLETNLDDIRRRHPAFVTALFDFAFARRSEGQLVALEAKMRGCRCNLRDETVRSLHLEVQGLGALQPWKGFVDVSSSVFRPIHNYIIAIPPGQLDNYYERHFLGGETKKFIKDRGLERIVQCLIVDVDGTLEACQTWFKLTKDSWIIGFLSHCITHFPSSFHAGILRFPVLIREITIEFGTIVNQMKETKSCPSETFRPLTHYAFFLRSLEMLPYSSLRAHIEPHAPALYDTFITLFSTLADPTFERFEFQESLPRMFGSTAKMMHEYIPVEVRPVLDERVRRECERVDVVRNVNLPYSSMCVALVLYERSVECLNPDCGKKPEPDKTFSKCGGCGIVSYCSRECQKRSWSLYTCPHKKVCKTWSLLHHIWRSERETAGRICALDSEVGGDGDDGCPNAEELERALGGAISTDGEKTTTAEVGVEDSDVPEASLVDQTTTERQDASGVPDASPPDPPPSSTSNPTPSSIDIPPSDPYSASTQETLRTLSPALLSCTPYHPPPPPSSSSPSSSTPPQQPHPSSRQITLLSAWNDRLRTLCEYHGVFIGAQGPNWGPQAVVVKGERYSGRVVLGDGGEDDASSGRVKDMREERRWVGRGQRAEDVNPDLGGDGEQGQSGNAKGKDKKPAAPGARDRSWNWNIAGIVFGDEEMLDVYVEMQKLGRARSKRTKEGVWMGDGARAKLTWV